MVLIPVRKTKTYSIDAAGSTTGTVAIDFMVKKVNVVLDVDVSTTLTFGGKNYTASFDVEDDFGAPCKDDITVSASNSGAASEDLTLEILGYRIERK